MSRGTSVNSAAGRSLTELTAPNPQTGYPGIPHNQVGVTTVGAVRAAGGDVTPSPSRTNPYHATLGGLTGDVYGAIGEIVEVVVLTLGSMTVW